MDFETIVMHNTEEKFINLYNGENPISTILPLKLDTGSVYEENRNKYLKRLENEFKQINQSINTIKENKRNRLIEESRKKYIKKNNRKKCSLSIWVLLFLIGFTGLLAYYGMKQGISYWARNHILQETGFSTFFSIFNSSNNIGLVSDIVAIVIGAILYVASVIMLFVKYRRTNKKGWKIWGIIFLVSLVAEGGIGSLSILFIRLLIVPIGYLIYFLLSPYGCFLLCALAILFLIIIFRKLSMVRYKLTIVFVAILSICISLGGWYIGVQNAEVSTSYIEAHDGSSFEKAVILNKNEKNKQNTYKVYIMEQGESYYFVYDSTSHAKYSISTEGASWGRKTQINIFSADGSLLASSENNDSDGNSEIIYEFMSDTRYFISVKYNDQKSLGYFKLKFDLKYIIINIPRTGSLW